MILCAAVFCEVTGHNKIAQQVMSYIFNVMSCSHSEFEFYILFQFFAENQSKEMAEMELEKVLFPIIIIFENQNRSLIMC